jgi:hypothetical protein
MLYLKHDREILPGGNTCSFSEMEDTTDKNGDYIEK